MLKSNERAVKYAWISPYGDTLIVDAYQIVYYKRKQHSKYSFAAKNSGKDLIFQTRLRIAERMGLSLDMVENIHLWSYLYDAELGIILH